MLMVINFWYDRHMKKLILLFTGIIIGIGVLSVPQTAYAGVNDFTFKDFEGNYYLSRDSDGRSSLKVVEVFTAEFPRFNQNKGVVRAIPSTYDGHSVSVKVQSLRRNGKTEPIYSQYQKNDHWVVETGDDDYVRGNQVYELIYTLRDVTKDFGDHQEFYWDTVGTGSSQPFGSVKGVVHLDSSVSNLFTGKTACYEGLAGSRTACRISNDGATITFSSLGKIGAYQNVSMVMEFKQDSFAAYQVNVWELVRAYGIMVVSILTGIVGLVWIFIQRFAQRGNAKGRGTIIPEYLPPSGISVLEASDIKGNKIAALSAQLIDLAVRHKIRIIEKQEASNRSTYQLEVLSLDGLSDDDAAVLRVTTGLQIGATYTLSSDDHTEGALLLGVHQKASKRMLERGYRQTPVGGKRARGAAMLLLGLAAFVPFGLIFVFAFIEQPNGGELGSGLLPLFFTPFITWPMFFLGSTMAAFTKNPLTESGVALKDYLEGLEMYMKVAEADRLRILQSPQGAERTPINTDDKAQVVLLYERLLPYAILFGIEKDWAKTLEIAYGDVNTAPDWYSGTNTFGSSAFSTSLAGFASTAASSFTPPTSSSSSGSGFSSGGGSSGGGGGGGSFGGR